MTYANMNTETRIIRRVRSRELRTCSTCHGKGFQAGVQPDSCFTCPDCLGTGEASGSAIGDRPSAISPNARAAAPQSSI